MTDYMDEIDELYIIIFGIVVFLFESCLFHFWVNPSLVDLPNNQSGFLSILIACLAAGRLLALTLNVFPLFFQSYRETQRLAIIIFYPF